MDIATQMLNSNIRTAKLVFGETISTDYLFQLLFMDKLPANYDFQIKAASSETKFANLFLRNGTTFVIK